MSRIADVESIAVLGRFHLVRVTTDDGTVGIGEIYPSNVTITDAVVREALRPLLIGEPASDIERLWHRMYRAAYRVGPMGVQLQAIAGIDIALWDILGQQAGLPIYQLLGGAYRPEVKLYASSMSRTMTPEEEGQRALGFKEQGFHGYKIHSATPWMHDDGFDQTVATAAAVREAVGPDFPIMVDVNNAYYPHTAVRIARELEKLNIWHFEEPLVPHDYPSYRELAQTVDIPVAAGEQEYSPWQFRDLIVQGGVDIIQPDIIKCGGITSFVKIATLADAFSKPVTSHNTQPTISTAAHLHVWLSQAACVYPQEYNIEAHPMRDEHPVWDEPLEIVDGTLKPPTRPGLGVRLDDAMVASIRTN
jgi:L-alanine-DL-glutamate epimerase-like enolase superfamily enzyme